MITNSDPRAIEKITAVLDADNDWLPLSLTLCEYRQPVIVARVTDDGASAGFATIRPTDVIGEVSIALVDETPITLALGDSEGFWVLPAHNGIARDVIAALVATSARAAATRRNTAKKVAVPHVAITPNGVTLPTHKACGNVQSVLATGGLTCQPCASASAKKSQSAATPTAVTPDAFDPMAEFLASDESASA
jgi:hypothetical protein